MRMVIKNERFEPLDKPYDMFSISSKGYFINVDNELKQHIYYDKKGAYSVLNGSHKKTRKFYIAPLVADMFLRNTGNLGYLYFKDGDNRNSNVSNLGYAINPDERRHRVDRPLRKSVESERHRLIIEINNAIERNNWFKAKKLGVELWELEGANWVERNE